MFLLLPPARVPYSSPAFDYNTAAHGVVRSSARYLPKSPICRTSKLTTVLNRLTRFRVWRAPAFAFHLSWALRIQERYRRSLVTQSALTLATDSQPWCILRAIAGGANPRSVAHHRDCFILFLTLPQLLQPTHRDLIFKLGSKRLCITIGKIDFKPVLLVPDNTCSKNYRRLTFPRSVQASCTRLANVFSPSRTQTRGS